MLLTIFFTNDHLRSWRFVVAGEELNTFVDVLHIGVQFGIVADWHPLTFFGIDFASGFNSFRDTEISRTFSICYEGFRKLKSI